MSKVVVKTIVKKENYDHLEYCQKSLTFYDLSYNKKKEQLNCYAFFIQTCSRTKNNFVLYFKKTNFNLSEKSFKFEF